MQVTADVPDDNFLLIWAADPHKQLAVSIAFRNAVGGAVLETVSMASAYCVSYDETFRHGDATSGAYQVAVTLSDPSGFIIQAGNPVSAFVAPAPSIPSSPPVAALLTTTPIGAAKKAELIAGTPAHKAARWAAYQQKNANNSKAWDQARWEKQYATNMRNVTVGLGREKEYRDATGAVSKTLKTPLTKRQIDLYREDELYCGQLKTDKMSLNKQARTEGIPKDAELVKAGFEVEYSLEKGASKPLLDALTAAGVTYKLKPQIP